MQDQPSAAQTCIFNIMHVHDLADSSNVTQQGNFLGPDGVFLERSAINRVGSVEQGHWAYQQRLWQSREGTVVDDIKPMLPPT